MGGSSSSRSGSALKWARPYAKAAAAETQGVYDEAKPGLNSITDLVQGMLPGIQDKYQAGNPALNAATAYDTNLLARDPWAGSSQLDNLINSTNQNVRDQVGASFGSRGSFGGTAYANALARGLASNEAGLRYQDANNIMQMQQAASANAPQKAAADYLGISPLLAAAQTGAALPYTGINALSSDLASLFSGSKSKTSEGIGSLIGSGLQAGAMVFSDRRLKANIECVGEMPDGLGVYEFEYVWGPERYRGVMADEVAEMRPWALGPEIAGYATVDYSRLQEAA